MLVTVTSGRHVVVSNDVSFDESLKKTYIEAGNEGGHSQVDQTVAEVYDIDDAQNVTAGDYSAKVDDNGDDNLISATETGAQGTTGEDQDIVTYYPNIRRSACLSHPPETFDALLVTQFVLGRANDPLCVSDALSTNSSEELEEAMKYEIYII